MDGIRGGGGGGTWRTRLAKSFHSDFQNTNMASILKFVSYHLITNHMLDSNQNLVGGIGEKKRFRIAIYIVLFHFNFQDWQSSTSANSYVYF